MTITTLTADSSDGERPLVAPTTKHVLPTAWWGMAVLITTESMIFVILLSAYFFVRASSPQWPPPGVPTPELYLSLPFSFVLWGSSLPIFYAESAIKRGSQAGLRLGLALSFAMGLAFVAFTIKDFNDLTFGWRDNAYGSLFYVIVGLHAIHVVLGLCMNLVVQVKAWQRKFGPDRHLTVDVFSLYWHFVDAVWIFVFLSLFVSEATRR
ncbi:MAG TPA: cytochrome c oxidase subunit 3 [Acidimicrobiia bacterium]|jgi:cytochrome c oxidase subunit 3